METSTSGVDEDNTSKDKEITGIGDDVTIDKVEVADGVDSSELAALVAVDTKITFVDDEGFADAEDSFTDVGFGDLQSPKPA